MRNINKKISKELKTVPFNPDFDYVCCGDAELSKQKETKLQEYIGKLFMSFSFLENGLNDALCYLINNGIESNMGILIIRKMFFKQKLNLYKDIVSDFIITCISDPKKKENLLDRLNNIIKKSEELSEFRNDIAHTDWAIPDKDNFYIISIEIENKRETNIYYKKIKITPSIMIKFVRQNEALKYKFYELVEDMYHTI